MTGPEMITAELYGRPLSNRELEVIAASTLAYGPNDPGCFFTPEDRKGVQPNRKDRRRHAAIMRKLQGRDAQ